MPDWTDNWQDEIDNRHRWIVERALVHLDDLAVRYMALGGLITPPRSAAGGRRSAPGPGVPIRVDVVDLASDVERFARKEAELIAGTLRVRRSGAVDTVAALRYIGDHLGRASLADPSLADDVEGGAASLRWRARHLVGEVAAAFAVDVDCPECSIPALWVHPGRGLVRCGMESCGAEWTVGDIAVPVWSARQSTRA